MFIDDNCRTLLRPSMPRTSHASTRTGQASCRANSVHRSPRYATPMPIATATAIAPHTTQTPHAYAWMPVGLWRDSWVFQRVGSWVYQRVGLGMGVGRAGRWDGRAQPQCRQDLHYADWRHSHTLGPITAARQVIRVVARPS